MSIFCGFFVVPTGYIPNRDQCCRSSLVAGVPHVSIHTVVSRAAFVSTAFGHAEVARGCAESGVKGMGSSLVLGRVA